MRASRVRLAAALAIGWLLVGQAVAQWAWKDDNGRLVFSDRPPPSGVKPDMIVRQPGQGSAAAPALRPSAEPARTEAGKGGPRTMAEREMDYRKRQAEQAEADKKQADQQAFNARRQQECDRSRGYLKALEDGLRVARTDAQGNREILDDSQRNAEITRVREMLARDCAG